MPNGPAGQVAIIDYGMGNLFSVSQACEKAGLQSFITSVPQEISTAAAVILPGVGAFGDAMDTLVKLDLVSVIQDIAASPKPLVGICLGMQLMMTESNEFGNHRGLGIIEGEVVRLEESVEDARVMKIPQVGWNQIHATRSGLNGKSPNVSDETWDVPLLKGIPDGEYMYFVHSFYSKPVDDAVVVSTTRYAGIEFCSSVRLDNLFACQFHPERSGLSGLQVYRNLSDIILN